MVLVKFGVSVLSLVMLLDGAFASEEILYSEATTGGSVCEDYYAVEYDPRRGLEVTHSSETCEQVCSKYLSCESYYVTNGICIICTRQTVIEGITEIDARVRARPTSTQRIRKKGLQSPTVDMALGKPATLSSIGNEHPASVAVDGCLDTRMTTVGCGCTHTVYNGGIHWWSVDLETTTTVSRVVIYNRADAVGSRLSNFDVTVSTDNMDPTLSTDSTLCYYFAEASTDGATETINCDQPVTGRYVTIQLRGGPNLSLCEVQVYQLYY